MKKDKTWIALIPGVALYLLVQIQKNQESFINTVSVTLLLYFNMAVIFILTAILLIGVFKVTHDVKACVSAYKRSYNTANKLLEMLESNGLIKE